MKKLIVTTIAFFAVIFSSCTTAYIPNEINTPSFHDSNEFKGSLSYGSSGTNLNAGYSFSKHFAGVAEVSYLRKGSDYPEFQRNWGGGLAYFGRLANEKNIYYEFITGFNIMETRSSFDDRTFGHISGFENARYNKIYLQEDLTFAYTAVDFIFSMRFNYMNFTGYETDRKISPGLPVALGMEPAFTFRFGSPYVKIKWQFGFSATLPVSGPEFNYDKFFSHVGLDFSF